MAEEFGDWPKLLREIDEVKALLVSNGVKDDVNANEIFEKLESRTTECGRVNEVVGEILAELHFKEPEVIVIDDDQDDPEVEVLLDLNHDLNPNPESIVNGFGDPINRVNDIVDQQRGVKRDISFGPYPIPETSKRSLRETLLNDAFVEVGALSVEEGGVLEEIGTLPAVDTVLPEEILGLNFAEDVLPFIVGSSKIKNKLEVKPCNDSEGALSSSHGSDVDASKVLFDSLITILPHIEPYYLKRIGTAFSRDEKRLNEFINRVIENEGRLPEVQILGETRINLENEVLPSSSKSTYETQQAGIGAMQRSVAAIKSPNGHSLKNELHSDGLESSYSIHEIEGAAAGNLPVVGTKLRGDGNVNQTTNVSELTESVEGNENGESNCLKVDLYTEQLEYLVAVLPDADPNFLEELVAEFEGNKKRLKDFVAAAMENVGNKPMYPTRGESQKKQEQEALAKRFTENFSVKDFLEVFPDPVGFYENPDRVPQLKYRKHCMAYLQSRFYNLYIHDLSNTFKKRRFNLTFTVQDLEKWKGARRKTKRTSGDCQWPKEQSIPFLQEVAYIENKHKILQYLKEKQDKRLKAFNEAKLKNELLTCGCCYDDELLAEDMATCRDGHLFCLQCIKKGAEVIIGDGKSSFPCMDGNCKAEFTLATLQGILVPGVFGKLVQRLQAEEVHAAGIEGLETCPSCPYSTIPAQEDKVFKCLNPDCMKETCRNCKEPNHIPLRCEEVERSDEVKARTYIEDRMTEALVRTCWKCNKKFIKEGGCNKMSCPCGAAMCYICRQPVEGYKHFNPYEGQESVLCPLYSNDGKINFEAVKTEAERAKVEVMNQNPEVRLMHDPTLKLPVVPSRSRIQPVPPFREFRGHLHARRNFNRWRARVVEPVPAAHHHDLNRQQLLHIDEQTAHNGAPAVGHHARIRLDHPRHHVYPPPNPARKPS